MKCPFDHYKHCPVTGMDCTDCNSNPHKDNAKEPQKAAGEESNSTQLLSGTRLGKSYRNFMAFILSVKRGDGAEMHGDGYVVLSRKRYDELTKPQ